MYFVLIPNCCSVFLYFVPKAFESREKATGLLAFVSIFTFLLCDTESCSVSRLSLQSIMLSSANLNSDIPVCETQTYHSLAK